MRDKNFKRQVDSPVLPPRYCILYYDYRPIDAEVLRKE